MAEYTFETLSSTEFEHLARDLLQAEWGIRLESFKPGRDEGIDLRYARSDDGATIVQCKQYARSGFHALLRDLKKEVLKVERLAPERYVVVTSVGLSPANKRDVATLFPATREDDVYGQDDLNNLIGLHPEVEEQHPKLFLSSIPVLERVIGRAMRTATPQPPGEPDLKGYLRNVATLEAASVTLDVVNPPQRDRRNESRPKRQTLAEALDRETALIVTAPAGAGKSVMLRGLVTQMAAMSLAEGSVVPVLVEPRDLAPHALIAHALNVRRPDEPPLTEAEAQRLLGAGRLLVVLDDAHRVNSRTLQLLLDYQSCGTRFVVGGRPSTQLDALGLPVREVALLTQEQKDALAPLWSSDPHLPYNLTAEDALASRPMGLRFLIEAYEGEAWSFGRDRADLFGRVLTSRLRSEASHLPDVLTDPEIVRRLLGALALERSSDRDDPYGASPTQVRRAFKSVCDDLHSSGDVRLSPPSPDPFVQLDLLRAEPDPRLGLRYTFGHDQWHEYFAACELVRTHAPIGTVRLPETRQEVVRFAAALGGPQEEVAHPDVWDRFWDDLSAFDIALAFEALDIQKDRRGPDGRHFTSHADHVAALDGVEGYGPSRALAQLQRYLESYRSLIERHTPLVRRALDPQTTEPIGLWVDGNDMSHLPHWVGVKKGFVPLRPGEPDVSVQTPLEYTYVDRRLDRPRSISTAMYEGIPRLPARRALGKFRRELERACHRGDLWDPDPLLQERAYYQAVALFEAETRKREPIPTSIDADALLNQLRKRQYPRKGALRSHQINVMRVDVTVHDLERSLGELAERGLDATTLDPPIPPPWTLLDGRTDGSRFAPSEIAAQTTWAVQYLELVYRIMVEVVERSFPTAVPAIDAVGHGLPYHLVVGPLSNRAPVRPDNRYAEWAPVTSWEFVDATLGERVNSSVVSLFEDGQVLAEEAGASPYVGFPLTLNQRPTWPPLRIGVYSRLRHSLERFVKR